MALDIVILAAGKGTRMKSALPKVLHRLAGRPLLLHVLDTCATLNADRTVIVTGYAAEQIERCVGSRVVRCVRQEPQLGTGHAVQQAAPLLDDDGTTLILNGDVPLISADTARHLIAACDGRRLALLTLELDDPIGYGRIVRAGAAVRGIVEHKDASEGQRAIREVYAGIMAAPTAALKQWLARLTNQNAQHEYYLTDVVAMAAAHGVPVATHAAHDETEVLGVNSPAQLADLERRVQRRQAETLMAAGVRLADPARLDVRGELSCGSDVEIDVNCVFEGRVVIGDGARIGAHCVLRDTAVGAGAEVLPFCHFTDAVIGERAQVGPFARLRPGAQLGPEVHIGNFVEVKNSTLARGAKANHLAYLGDSTVGERVNYGAGSITANYDGANKHRTVLGNDVHVGSNCVLVAPVTVGDGATIGAGSVVSKAAPSGQLTVARARQATIANWSRPVKQRKP
ncbi:MAG TPA: bifunctional UDP-N-acetylglucosamine diphosphorylase/glucosamine-1-phosphate N-acetyltransferase GlmU [Burkholderiaceae bacterium]